MKVKELIERLQVEVAKNPSVANYDIIWSNADYVNFEVRNGGGVELEYAKDEDGEEVYRVKES